MLQKALKSLLTLAFSLFLILVSMPVLAGEPGQEGHPTEEKEKLNIKEVIFGHIMDGHEFHFFDITQADGTKKPVSIPLPVLLYSPQRGVSFFMSSNFHHGHEPYNDYMLLNEHNIHELGLDPKKFTAGTIIPIKDGKLDSSVSVFDLSLTRNVVQMLIALALLVWIMMSIAKRYKAGQGVTTAPKGMQSLLEPVITFVRDEVAKPNLSHKADKYLPYLLTVFFFILINNIFGLIPGTANVTGNIAFTVVLGLISFVVILFSSNGHYWGHIFNPPGVPGFVKPILVLVEFLSVFIKPFALIIRLFANMVAGHIIIICLISLIFIFGNIKPAIGYAASPVSLVFTIFIYFIEVLVAFLQAFIFTNLTAVFIGQAFEGEHHHEEAHAAAH
ncbi:MAG: F0F1 ATP synthase subunit A [Chitinophagales bacterium]|nr:F0F1 ATP synthase subunit A [Chitinophagales bacterium]